MTREESMKRLNKFISMYASPRMQNIFFEDLSTVSDVSTATIAEFLGWEEDQEYVANDDGTLLRLHDGRIESKGGARLEWTPVRNETRQEHFDWLRTLKKHTPRYIVPLPGLVTSDGEQQYLTHAYGSFFASRRNHSMRQTWKKEHLSYLPEEYRQYAVLEGELNED